MIIGIDASRANVTEKTGTEWYSWHLIQQLVPLFPNHEIRLYTREPLQGGLESLGPNATARVLQWPVGLLWSHVRLSWELWRRPPDLLFVPADTVPLIHPRRTITTIHDVGFERWPELYRGKSVQRRMGWLRPFVHLAVRLFTLGRYSASERDYHRWSARHALRASEKILTVSEFSKQEIIATLHAQPEQLLVTPLGVRQPDEHVGLSPDEIHSAQARHQLTKPYFLFIGRLEQKKNIRLLIEAYQRYREMSPDPVDLVLIGAPGFGWSDVQTAIPAATRPSIHQLGWIDEVDRWRLQAGARAFIFLSTYEGFGLPPLEAASVGVPVLSSRLGSLPEVLGPAAHYVESLTPVAVAEKMEQISTNQNMREELITAGRKRARMYTWEGTAKLTAAAFIRVLPSLAKETGKW